MPKTPAAAAKAEGKSPPQQARAVQTRESLLDAAGALLAEVGIERISSNLICQRAGVTPPALYRYFDDKFAVIEALGQRLMDRQNEALIAWSDRYISQGIEVALDHLEEMMAETARVTENEPGGIWVERALYATPSLEHIRIESHHYVTDRLTDALAPHLPHASRDAIWARVRMAIELTSAVDKLLYEGSASALIILAETSRLVRFLFLNWDD